MEDGLVLISLMVAVGWRGEEVNYFYGTGFEGHELHPWKICLWSKSPVPYFEHGGYGVISAHGGRGAGYHTPAPTHFRRSIIKRQNPSVMLID